MGDAHRATRCSTCAFFRNPRFSAASAAITLTSFALYGSTFLLTQYFQFVLGYSPFEAGLLARPVAVGMMVDVAERAEAGAPLGHQAGRRDRALMIAAPAWCSTRSNTIMSSFVGGVRGAALVRRRHRAHLGARHRVDHGLAADRAEPASGSAINDTTRQTGGALGVAVIGSVFLAARTTISPTRRKGLPAASAAALHDSIGQALELASTLPAKQGAALIELSRQAFIDAMRITYPIAAAFIVFAAFIAWQWLPAHGSDDDVAAHPSDEAREIAEYEILGM